MSRWQQAFQNGTGPDWCWLPGWSFAGTVFAQYWSVLPGTHWYADYNDMSMSLSDMVSELATTAPAQAIWCGWSLGGALASLAADRADAQALVTFATGRTFLATTETQGNDNSGMPVDDFAQFTQSMQADPERTLRRFISLCCQHSDEARPLQRFLSDHQYPEHQRLQHTLQWLSAYALTSASGVRAGHWYSNTDALHPQGLQPSLHCTAGSHGFAFSSQGQAQIITWFREVLLGSKE